MGPGSEPLTASVGSQSREQKVQTTRTPEVSAKGWGKSVHILSQPSQTTSCMKLPEALTYAHIHTRAHPFAVSPPHTSIPGPAVLYYCVPSTVSFYQM